MGFHGGAETTLEDEIIYSEEISPLIDKAVKDLMILTVSFESEHSAHEVRSILETLIFKIVKQERGL